MLQKGVVKETNKEVKKEVKKMMGSEVCSKVFWVSDISKRKRPGPMISTIIGPVAMCLVRLSSASR